MPRHTSHPHAPARSKREAEQEKWLAEKFANFLHHQANKTLRRFFHPLYEEYFKKWPVTPTEEEVSNAGGNVPVATSKIRGEEEHKLYRWMHNRTRSKNGVKGQGSAAILTLTAGPPKKKAAVQAYVKYYWESKIKEAVISRWAPTPETDLFGEIENGEDQVAWEAMTPMEKNIPLWFRMEVGRKLFEAESEEVKAEVDRRREKERRGAIAASMSTTTFKTDEERLQVMRRFDENFPKLSSSLKNLCANILRDFGLHTTMIVGGPIVRNGGRFSTFTYESPGTEHKELTYSEFCGSSYETEIELRFIEYLKSCFPKETRQLYTLDPVPDMASAPPLPSATPVIPIPQPTAPIIPTLQVSSTPVPDSIGPIRTTRVSQTGGRLPSARVKKTGPPVVSSTSTESPQLEVSQVQLPGVNPLRATTLPSNTPVGIKPAEPNAPTAVTIPSGATSRPTEVPADDASDGGSYTSTLPDVFDVEMDDSTPATGPWMAIDHFTGEIIVNDDQPTPLVPSVPAVPTTPTGPSLPGVETAVTPRLGTLYLIETPPALLSEDEDVRPRWLMTAANKFLRFVPCVGSLGKVIDLYLAQEARLGYPTLSARLPLPSQNRPTEIAVFMKWGRKYSCGDNVNAEKFGAAVLEWWLTIQPTTRKDWPPVYNPLPDDFSFSYFNHGGPNGTFLMILCLGWWANALAPGMDFTSFDLVVSDVHWVLEQITGQA